jgi:hypothetical protein
MGLASGAAFSAEYLRFVREGGEPERGALIEFDMAIAVHRIWEVAGPMLRAAIRDTVTAEGEE